MIIFWKLTHLVTPKDIHTKHECVREGMLYLDNA